MKRALSSVFVFFLLVATSGCSTFCPFNTATRYREEWHATSLRAYLSDEDKVADQCKTETMTEGIKKLTQVCQAGDYRRIKNIASRRLEKICQSEESRADYGRQMSDWNKVESCMKEKGFERREIRREECYIKFM